MGTILNKKQMTEEDIKLQYITPAITSKWDTGRITMETRITDGKINLKGNFVVREKPKKADYILYINANNPIAIVEAKDNNHTVSHGLQQAMTYARMMGVPFAYSSNGDAFYEHDFLTGKERQLRRMRTALTNLNTDMVKENPDYVVRITGSDPYGKSKLDYFISVSAKYPVIATTSKLLSTGADCKMTKLIVLDQMIGSMTEFKQIIGRGTRLREKEGKTHFVVMDFRNVTRLFADPEWDGPIEQDDDYGKGGKPDGQGGGGSEPPVVPPVDPKDKPIVDENGCTVKVIGKTVSVYDANGKLLRQESIVDYTKSNILGTYSSLDNFIHQWTAEEKKEAIKEALLERGIDLEAMKADQNMSEVDDFDFICHVAFDRKPLTRRERANNVKKRDFLSKYSGAAREVLEALLDKYMNTGIYEIEKTEILKIDPFKKFGKPSKIAQYFGGKEGYLKAIRELEQELYKAG